MMAGFDSHKKCARCRDKGIGDDPCVKQEVCEICESFTDTQRSILSTPQYQIRREKKAGLLVSPSKVTIVGPVEDAPQEYQGHEIKHASSEVNEPEFFAVSYQSPSEFVSRQDLNALSNQLEEKFARFEALLSRTNIISTPKLPVSVTDPPVSDKPFINPSDPRATGPVRPPGQDMDQSVEKSTKKGNLLASLKSERNLPVPLLQPVNPVTCPQICLQPATMLLQPQLHRLYRLPSRFLPVLLTSLLQIPLCRPVPSPAASIASAPETGSGSTSVDQFVSPDQGSVMSEDDTFQAQSDKESEEGEISDAEVQEKNEEMNYRETVRAVRAFLGFTQIPDFKASTGDYDCSDNPWVRKHPRKSGKVSVELPADDWL